MFYKSDEYSEDEKRNGAFQTVLALREATSIAKRIPTQVRYEDAMNILYEIDPDAYYQVVDRLEKKNKSEEVDLAIARAEAQSANGNEISPQEILEKELMNIESDLKAKPKSRPLKKKKAKIIGAIEYFKPREPSENEILNQDFYLAKRSFAINEPIYEREKSKDYRLSNDRILRIRLLHPDNEERIIGADLVYEQYDLVNEKVRFTHLQYKVWDKDVLYFSQGNLDKQIDKLNNHICKKGFCLSRVGHNHTKNYRLPYCSAFLRPSDRLQSSDSSLMSSGLHVPICKVLKAKETEKKVSRDELQERSLSHGIFEEMFVNNLLGSRWLTLDQLEDFYKNIAVESNINTIRIHAQEIYLEPESETHLQKGK